MIIPPKLIKGDEIRIVAPARSLGIINHDQRETTIKTLAKFGLKVSFGNNVEEKDIFSSSSIRSRVEDIRAAFEDKAVKGILTAIGGFSANQLLRYLDFNLIKRNPKVFCGYSDITALQNAILKKCGLVTYSGPHFSTFGMIKGNEYTIEYFKKCLMNNGSFDVLSSEQWSDDEWYRDQEHRTFKKNEGWIVLQEGKCKGTIVGGNVCTFNLLHGTEYMPSLKNAILFVEDCVESEQTFILNFDRDIQSIIHQPGFEQVRGIVIGRFESKSGMTLEKLRKIIQTKKELEHLPVIANVDFGHTTPMITFPIGGTVELEAYKGKAKINIIEH